MNSAQRTQVRQSLIAQGFQRTGCTDDISAVGDYTETWTHPDGTTIDLKWAPRDLPTGANKWQAALEQVLDRAEPVAPGVDYSGSMTPALLDQATREAAALAAAMPAPRFETARPEVFAPFQHRKITITCTDDEKTETLTGYPVDAWRFSPTALGVRVVFDPAKPEYGDYIVLPDDCSWDVAPADSGPSYHHAPKVLA